MQHPKLTPSALARILGVSRQTVYYHQRHDGPSMTGRYAYPIFLAWLNHILDVGRIEHCTIDTGEAHKRFYKWLNAEQIKAGFTSTVLNV